MQFIDWTDKAHSRHELLKEKMVKDHENKKKQRKAQAKLALEQLRRAEAEKRKQIRETKNIQRRREENMRKTKKMKRRSR